MHEGQLKMHAANENSEQTACSLICNRTTAHRTQATQTRTHRTRKGKREAAEMKSIKRVTVCELFERLLVALLRGIELAKVAVELRLELVAAAGVLQHAPVGEQEKLLRDFVPAETQVGLGKLFIEF